MKATLIHNPKSGIFNGKTPEDLAQALEEVGYETILRTSESPEDLEEILKEADGVIAIAGGDGSVRTVATRLIGKNIPLIVLPMGTANNISRALSGDLDVMEIIKKVAHPQKQFFDVGRLYSPWGEDYFLESLGIGFYASVLKAYDPDQGKSIRRGVESILEGLEEYEQPKNFYITLDGRDISGDFLLVEILNTPTIGPRLRFAPHAEPYDGLFDVVRVKESQSNEIIRMISNLIKGEVDELPNVLVDQGKKLEIHWDGFPLHLDDQVLPGDQQGIWRNGETTKDYPSTLQIEILPKALEFWIPQSEQEEKG
jgi:diacylglycerol kinase (ATP)